MATLQEIKNEIAIKYGYKNWDELNYDGKWNLDWRVLCDEVAKLYAETKVKEISAKPIVSGSDYKEKYDKCIKVIKRLDAGIIGMYDL